MTDADGSDDPDDPGDHHDNRADDPDDPGGRHASQDSPEAVTFEPIGVVHTPFETTSDAPRQGFVDDAAGTIELDDAYAPGLAGVRAGDRAVVLWYADSGDRVVELGDGRGVFGTRAPARPNPVCVTTVEVLAVEGTRLHVRGVDMRDGTPVLDLKRALDPERDGRKRPPE